MQVTCYFGLVLSAFMLAGVASAQPQTSESGVAKAGATISLPARTYRSTSAFGVVVEPLSP
jgi:hypothetical protein